SPALQTYTQSMERLFKILEFDSFVQTVEMPGIITATNSTALKGNKVEWNVNSDSFLVTTNNMFVESRIVNYWAFIVTGFILLGFVTVILLQGFKK
ncbi:MAG: hypothetical protein Q8T08_18735, partial [Ignavibacteria bacterium]|nr:hypothetical protein [Ignavibacteria bacterium]